MTHHDDVSGYGFLELTGMICQSEVFISYHKPMHGLKPPVFQHMTQPAQPKLAETGHGPHGELGSKAPANRIKRVTMLNVDRNSVSLNRHMRRPTEVIVVARKSCVLWTRPSGH
jgi:hypothetical protein